MSENLGAEQILAVIESGNPEAAVDVLRKGVDVDLNHVFPDGDTLLHKAVSKGYAALASKLLMLGADFKIRNTKGQIALSEEFAGPEKLHAVRQAYHRDSLIPVSQDHISPEARAIAEAVSRDGIVKREGLLQGDALVRIQKDISNLVRRLWVGRLTGKSKYVRYDQREYWQKNHRSYVFNDPLLDSQTLVDFCETPLIREAADLYLGKKSHIKRVMGMRYLPSKISLDKQQFGWHHDMEDKQFKVMVLLTDIGPEDQYMAYIPGTHQGYFDYTHFLTNKLTYDEFKLDRATAKEIHTTGKAGDVYFFDSNGMHRGTRSNGKLRDALFIEYTADRNWKNIWGTDMDEKRKQKILQGNGTLLKEYVKVRPKWSRAVETTERKLPTWALSLNEPDLWV